MAGVWGRGFIQGFIVTYLHLVSCLGLLNGVANNHFAFSMAIGDMAQERHALYYPPEVLELNWNNTSKEKIQEAFKIWAGTYDRVCFELPKLFGREQPIFRQATSSFPAKWRRRNDCRNAVLMTSHYPADLRSASDWLKQISLPARLIRNST